MNNKGQSLVSFVLLLPIIILIIFAVYDIGRIVLLKNELNDINYLAIDYSLDNLENENLDDKIREIILKNKEDVNNIEVTINDGKVYVMIDSNIKFLVIKKINMLKVSSSYVGYFDNEKKIIERLEGNL